MPRRYNLSRKKQYSRTSRNSRSIRKSNRNYKMVGSAKRARKYRKIKRSNEPNGSSSLRRKRKYKNPIKPRNSRGSGGSRNSRGSRNSGGSRGSMGSRNSRGSRSSRGSSRNSRGSRSSRGSRNSIKPRNSRSFRNPRSLRKFKKIRKYYKNGGTRKYNITKRKSNAGGTRKYKKFLKGGASSKYQNLTEGAGSGSAPADPSADPLAAALKEAAHQSAEVLNRANRPTGKASGTNTGADAGTNTGADSGSASADALAAALKEAAHQSAEVLNAAIGLTGKASGTNTGADAGTNTGADDNRVVPPKRRVPYPTATAADGKLTIQEITKHNKDIENIIKYYTHSDGSNIIHLKGFGKRNGEHISEHQIKTQGTEGTEGTEGSKKPITILYGCYGNETIIGGDQKQKLISIDTFYDKIDDMISNVTKNGKSDNRILLVIDGHKEAVYLTQFNLVLKKLNTDGKLEGIVFDVVSFNYYETINDTETETETYGSKQQFDNAMAGIDVLMGANSDDKVQEEQNYYSNVYLVNKTGLDSISSEISEKLLSINLNDTELDPQKDPKNNQALLGTYALTKTEPDNVLCFGGGYELLLEKLYCNALGLGLNYIVEGGMYRLNEINSQNTLSWVYSDCTGEKPNGDITKSKLYKTLGTDQITALEELWKSTGQANEGTDASQPRGGTNPAYNDLGPDRGAKPNPAYVTQDPEKNNNAAKPGPVAVDADVEGNNAPEDAGAAINKAAETAAGNNTEQALETAGASEPEAAEVAAVEVGVNNAAAVDANNNVAQLKLEAALNEEPEKEAVRAANNTEQALGAPGAGKGAVGAANNTKPAEVAAGNNVAPSEVAAANNAAAVAEPEPAGAGANNNETGAGKGAEAIGNNVAPGAAEPEVTEPEPVHLGAVDANNTGPVDVGAAKNNNAGAEDTNNTGPEAAELAPKNTEASKGRTLPATPGTPLATDVLAQIEEVNKKKAAANNKNASNANNALSRTKRMDASAADKEETHKALIADATETLQTHTEIEPLQAQILEKARKFAGLITPINNGEVTLDQDIFEEANTLLTEIRGMNDELTDLHNNLEKTIEDITSKEFLKHLNNTKNYTSAESLNKKEDVDKMIKEYHGSLLEPEFNINNFFSEEDNKLIRTFKQ